MAKEPLSSVHGKAIRHRIPKQLIWKDQACEIDSRVQDRNECVVIGEQESSGWCLPVNEVQVGHCNLMSALLANVFEISVPMSECVLPVSDALSG